MSSATANQVVPGGDLPWLVCRKCIAKLDEVSNFKFKCISFNSAFVRRFSRPRPSPRVTAAIVNVPQPQSKGLTGGSSLDPPSSIETPLERKRRLARERKRRFRERHSSDMAWLESQDWLAEACKPRRTSQQQTAGNPAVKGVETEKTDKDTGEISKQQDWCVAGTDGLVRRPSLTFPPVEVFVKVGEDSGLPLKSDGSSVERDPLCTSEEALPPP
ncbi:uncharacterized protein [Hetaerina americana]|uniref:uncharacterized protein n=1 Tax=Hetaerina americana TaxID=62018 RepID=UPI003A7F47B7